MTKLKDLIRIMKDKASQGKAAFLSKRPTLSLLRATTHDSFTPPTEKHLSTLLSSGEGSRATASATVELLMDRLQTTESSAVALKCLIAVHHIIKRGTFILKDQLSVFPNSGGRNYLNLSDFRDKRDAVSWELSSWVRWYAKHVEQLLAASRTLGYFFLGAAKTTTSNVLEAPEDRASGLPKGDLLRETEALLAVVEGIGKRPDIVSMEGNKLVGEVVGLVEEDEVEALREVCVRVNEFRERLACLSFGEVVELVYVLKRLEGCKERVVVVGEKWRLWDWVRELKEKVEGMEMYREEEKMMMMMMMTESERFPVLNSLDLVRFPSARFF